MRAAVYLRISQDRSGEELGVTRQRQDAERLLAQRGWTSAAVFTENDTSAAGKVRRQQFEAMLDAIKAGEIDVIIAWSLDRLTRNARDRLALVETCQRHGVIIALVRGSDMDPSTPAGRLTLGILGEVAAHEIDVKADRQRRAARQAAERGAAPSSVVPFGFYPDRSHHPQQADAIRAAYSAVLAKTSLARIARTWNADPTLASTKLRLGRRKGEPSQWSAETVRALLLNPRNAALRALNGEIIGPAKWEPIVSEDVFHAVRSALTDPARRQVPPTPRHLLSGVARCGECDEAVVAGTTRPTYFSYRCRSRGHVARRGDHVDALIAGGVIEGVAVKGLVVDRMSRPDAADVLPRGEDGPDVGALRTEGAAIRARLDDLAAAFADGDITRTQLAAGTDRARAKLAHIEAELAHAGRTSVLAPLVSATDVAAVWANLDVDRQRAVIDTLMTIVLRPVGQGARRFDPESVVIEWRTA